jgi:gas vesicle protein
VTFAMTWIEVTDSALKIGLGALIAGLISLLLARAARTHELRKDQIRRRQDTIEKIAEEFERVQAQFVGLFATYSTYADHYQVPIIKDLQRKKVVEAMNGVETALHSLHTIESKLLLLGLDSCTQIVVSYRLAVVELQNQVRLEPPFPDKTKFESSAKNFSEIRTRFYKAISKAYSSKV